MIYADEWVGSHRLQARFFSTEVEEERLLRYTIGFPYSLLGAGGRFEITSSPGGSECDFTAEVHFGWRVPVIGPLLDRLLRALIPVDELRRHMREEGENLVRLVAR